MEHRILGPKEQIDIMLYEYNTLRQQTLNYITMLQAIAALILTVTGTLIGFIYSSGAHEIFLALPPFLVTFFAQETRVWQSMLQIGRYLSVVEKRINSKAGESLLVWESTASPARDKNWASSGIIARTSNPDLVLTTLFFCIMIGVYAWALFEGVSYVRAHMASLPWGPAAAAGYAIANGFAAVLVAFQRFVRIDRFMVEYERQVESSLL